MKRLFLVAGCFSTTIATAAMVTIFDDDNEEFTYTLRNQLVIQPNGDVQLSIVEDIDLGGGGGGNVAPVANNDSFSIVFETATTINPSLNDSDADGNLDRNSLTILSGPSNGTASEQTGGNVLYTPNAGYDGPDSFTYRISDTEGLSDTANVSITVLPEQMTGNCSTDHPPQGGFARNTQFISINHCNFGVVNQLSLTSTQYFALRFNATACPETSGRFFYGPNAGSGQPMRVTISRCPGVFNDDAPPKDGDQFLTSCSRPSIAENTILWSIANDQFTCRINPGQEVYLNIVYGDDSEPPIATCDSSPCAFIVQPLSQ